MNYFMVALQTEILKIIKSKVFLFIMIACLLIPLMAGFFMFILKDPTIAKKAGLLGAKAQIAGEASWPSYLILHAQMIAVGGLIIYSFLVSWVFGREFAHGTVKDLLALPLPRSIIVTAKFIATFIIGFFLLIFILFLGLCIGWMIGLPNFSVNVLKQGVYTIVITALLTLFLCTPIGFVASVGRGFIAPISFLFFVLFLSQILSMIGYGEFFPWSIPSLYSGFIETVQTIHPKSFILVLCTGFSGWLGTMYWWKFADHH